MIKELVDAWECVQKLCPKLNIKFEYNQEENSIKLDNAFYIYFSDCTSSGKYEPNYCVSVAKFLPSDRDTPPDVDIIDLELFKNSLQAVQFAVKKIKEIEIELLFNDYAECNHDEEMASIEKEMEKQLSEVKINRYLDSCWRR
jgi:hypothetical protein